MTTTSWNIKLLAGESNNNVFLRATWIKKTKQKKLSIPNTQTWMANSLISDRFYRDVPYWCKVFKKSQTWRAVCFYFISFLRLYSNNPEAMYVYTLSLFFFLYFILFCFIHLVSFLVFLSCLDYIDDAHRDLSPWPFAPSKRGPRAILIILTAKRKRKRKTWSHSWPRLYFILRFKNKIIVLYIPFTLCVCVCSNLCIYNPEYKSSESWYGQRPTKK